MNEVQWPPHIPVSQCCKSMISRLLEKDPKERLGFKNGATELKAHDWFDGFDFALVRVSFFFLSKIQNTNSTKTEYESSNRSWFD